MCVLSKQTGESENSERRESITVCIKTGQHDTLKYDPHRYLKKS